MSLLKSLVTSLLVAGTLALAAPGAMAESLDDYLKPHCGVDYVFPLNQVLSTYHDEILNRAAGYSVLTPSAENDTLMWLVGAIRTPEARQLASDIMVNGNPEFRRHVMGAVSAQPDWTGLPLVLLGAQDSDDMTRDSAASVLADMDYTTLDARAPMAPQVRDTLVKGLQPVIASETDPRLRANFQQALGKLQGLSLNIVR